ncbi:putative Phosphinothricin N-acetyltransferase [Vibrio nigripulchritudo MADA3029]|uniref:Phosphinothricin N-acetyltransferase n=2 Tax=Vibrio nigripulchritudo TaxID=28173 RepID=A0AAV2VLL9_9VIBR|nr:MULTISPECIES: GNAT family N-acetyltransferase [Vibrio]UAB73949.1 N-acetyltransferase [Vibrio sp. SCSIO 43132]CCN33765.1 putative Phosphinothricin N-acetyltransferase [Vibrio nigripulchritudo AM115]CCN41967.1 putative Phosphinothricin N-acetyltransferase [Vibrio nigripulchritudo FTn2]CCN47542.1 putative Phosphinothricin N-acetyltransferase [Vibrio nigripulchritudo MADA3020]CCN55950.1 putative Phosphinothricin N-acetyltransferase [Vibrio nigripulchritudo MADA3021]
MEIRYIESQDIEAITNIYNYFIANSTATFEERSISPDEMNSRVGKVQGQGLPWIVILDSERVVGYAYAGLWHARSAYRFTTESTIYVSPNASGRGVGKKLYSHLISILKARGMQSVIGVVSLPNASSVALHKSLGFTQVGEFKKVGTKFGDWIDVSYWQLDLKK